MRKIAETKRMLSEKQMTKRMICRISRAIIVTSILAAIIIPAVYRSRGYMDVGGEWLFLIGVFFLVCKI